MKGLKSFVFRTHWATGDVERVKQDLLTMPAWWGGGEMGIFPLDG